MDRIEVRTTVHVPPETAYDFLVDFPRYARYSEYLREVRTHGDGTPGTVYDLRFGWWKLTYTARSEVTGVDRPNELEWRLVKDIDAVGRWRVEEVDPPAGVDAASEVIFEVTYHPDTADENAIDLPLFVSLDWVIEKVKPKVQAEARRIVERVVADLEGEPRDVDLEVRL